MGSEPRRVAVEKDDEGRPYACGAFVSNDSRWFCRLASDHDGDHEWVQRAPEPAESDHPCCCGHRPTEHDDSGRCRVCSCSMYLAHPEPAETGEPERSLAEPFQCVATDGDLRRCVMRPGHYERFHKGADGAIWFDDEIPSFAAWPTPPETHPHAEALSRLIREKGLCGVVNNDDGEPGACIRPRPCEVHGAATTTEKEE